MQNVAMQFIIFMIGMIVLTLVTAHDFKKIKFLCLFTTTVRRKKK